MKISKVLCHNIFVDYKRVVYEIETPASIGASFTLNAVVHIPPYPDTFKAIWDTGATGTCISESIATKFQLRRSGQVDIQGVTGMSVCNTYLLALHLPNGVIIPELEVSGCVENIGCDILIGMDVITMGDFAVCNANNTTTFSFRIPSVAQINFTSPDAPVCSTKIGRNSPCPCGSGKKFKKCHGA